MLLLDSDPENLLRVATLRKHGYLADTAGTIGEAEKLLNRIDVVVLDADRFGSQVARVLRGRRPEVPIITISPTLQQPFGGVEDMHLLKDYSSVDDLIAALHSFEAKHRGRPVVVDARDFFYSRIAKAIGEDVVLEILSAEGEWMYVNDACARLLEHPRDWFLGKNMFVEMPDLAAHWKDILRTVAENRETYIDRTYHGLLSLPRRGEEWAWNVLAFPLTLHNDEAGLALSARIEVKTSSLQAPDESKVAAGTACVDLPQSPDPEPQKTETEVNRDTLKWREAFLRSNPYLTSAQISVGASRAKNKSEIASRWAREKKIFAVRHRGQQLFPRFQFQDGLPLRVISRVIAVFPEHATGWDIAYFFANPNPYIEDRKPIDLLKSDPDRVVSLAEAFAHPANVF